MSIEPMTLLICTHNRGARIQQTLDAVYAMDRVGGRLAELLVIDNASTDDTPEVVDRAIAGGPAIPTRRILEPTIGVVHARKRGVREARTPVVAWLDDDVLPSPDWAYAILNRLDHHPRAGVVGSRISLHWESGPTALARRFSVNLAEQDLGDEPVLLSKPSAGLVTAALAARRKALVESGWTEQSFLCGPTGRQLGRGEDFEMVIRVRQAGWEAWYEPSATVEHLIPADRQSRAYLANLLTGLGEADAWLDWIVHGRPGPEWVDENYRRVLRRYRKSRLLEWNPTKRFARLHNRAGQLRGFRQLHQQLTHSELGPGVIGRAPE